MNNIEAKLSPKVTKFIKSNLTDQEIAKNTGAALTCNGTVLKGNLLEIQVAEKYIAKMLRNVNTSKPESTEPERSEKGRLERSQTVELPVEKDFPRSPTVQKQRDEDLNKQKAFEHLSADEFLKVECAYGPEYLKGVYHLKQEDGTVMFSGSRESISKISAAKHYVAALQYVPVNPFTESQMKKTEPTFKAKESAGLIWKYKDNSLQLLGTPEVMAEILDSLGNEDSRSQKRPTPRALRQFSTVTYAIPACDLEVIKHFFRDLPSITEKPEGNSVTLEGHPSEIDQYKDTQSKIRNFQKEDISLEWIDQTVKTKLSIIESKYPKVFFKLGRESVAVIGKEGRDIAPAVKEIKDTVIRNKNVQVTKNLSRQISNSSAPPGTGQEDKNPPQQKKLPTNAKCGSFKDFQVFAHTADILKISTDGIVNPTNSQMNITFGISSIIMKVAGNIVKSECASFSSKRNLKEGEVFVTKSGDLKNCKHILHIPGPAWNHFSFNADGADACLESLQKTILNLLDEANTKKLKSVAIPAIGAGNFMQNSSLS